MNPEQFLGPSLQDAYVASPPEYFLHFPEERVFGLLALVLAV